MEFLVDWLYETWFKLPKLDYFIVLLISLVITIVGFLQGVGLGLAIAIVLFVTFQDYVIHLLSEHLAETYQETAELLR